ncbi:MAG: signal recognition particle receptor subunit alpha, partial [Clostridia bacterium]
MGFFEKIRAGLSKTRDAVAAQVDGIIKTFTPLDEGFFSELEDGLIMADIGAQASMHITDELRARAKSMKLRSSEELREQLQ